MVTWVSSVRDVLFGSKGNGLGIYLRMSGVVALGSLLVQVTHAESGPVSEVGRTGGDQSNEWSGNWGAWCVHMCTPSSMYKKGATYPYRGVGGVLISLP